MNKVAQCDVIKMKEMRGEVGKKTPKNNPSFLLRHMADLLDNLSSYDYDFKQLSYQWM